MIPLVTSMSITAHDFVYDLFIESKNNDTINTEHHNDFVELCWEQMDFNKLVNDGEESDASLHDDEDSNEEDNWRNEYPDDDPFETSEEEGSSSDSESVTFQ